MPIFRYSMGPWLCLVTLLGLKFIVHGQIPPSQDPPTPPTEPPIPSPSSDLFIGDIPGLETLPLPDDGGVDLPPLNTQPAVSEIKPTEGPITSLAGNIQVYHLFSDAKFDHQMSGIANTKIYVYLLYSEKSLSFRRLSNSTKID